MFSRNGETNTLHERLKILENLWRSNGSVLSYIFENKVIESLDSYHNPYELLLHLSMHSSDCLKHTKNNFSHSVIHIFEHWLSKNPLIYEHQLNDIIKESALKLSTRKHTALFPQIAHIYQIRTLNLLKQIAFVRGLIDNKCFTKAAVVVAVLELHNSFNIYHEILLPLMLLDDIGLIKLVLRKKSDEQKIFMMLLDKYLANIQKLKSFASSLHYPPIKIDSINVYRLKKVLMNLLKFYDINSDLCPNIKQQSIMGSFLFYLKQNKTMSYIEENNHDMIKLYCHKFPALTFRFISEVYTCSPLNYSAHWYCKCNEIKLCQIPKSVLQSIKNSRASYHSVSSLIQCHKSGTLIKPNPLKHINYLHYESSPAQYYPLKVPLSKILMVNDANKFGNFLGEIKRQVVKMIGLDSEWNPTFIPKQKQEIALLQVALPHCVYLLDMKGLKSQLNPQHWHSFLSLTFNDPRVLKLGFDFHQDLNVLKSFQFDSKLSKGARRKANKAAKNAVENHLTATPFDSLTLTHFLDLRTFKDQFDCSRLPYYKALYPPDQAEAPCSSDSNLQKPGCSQVNDVKMPAKPKHARGLSELVYFCFGYFLDKREQLSVWESRPLRESQTVYAALDAYCLIDIYTYLKENIFYDVPGARSDHCKNEFSGDVFTFWKSRYPQYFKRDTERVSNGHSKKKEKSWDECDF